MPSTWRLHEGAFKFASDRRWFLTTLGVRTVRAIRDAPKIPPAGVIGALHAVVPSAMLAARVFFRAMVFSVRTSDDVHERRFDFLGIQ